MAIGHKIDLAADQHRLVLTLIERHLPCTEVWAYGSRVKWTSDPESDLDLVVHTGNDQSHQVCELREAFEESDLPFHVDVLVWNDLPKSFRMEIDREHSVLTNAPMSTIRFGDCATLVRDIVNPGKLRNTPYVGLEHIVKEDLVVYEHGVATDVSSQKFRFRVGDILFGKLRPYFRKVVRATFDGICSTDIWVVRVTNPSQVDQGFLFYCMAQKDFVDFATMGSEGTRMPRAKWDHIADYIINLPALDEQRSIATALENFDNKINANVRENRLLIAMRNGLLEKFFANLDK